MSSGRACPICTASMQKSFETLEAEYMLCPRCRYLKPWTSGLNPLELNTAIYRSELDRDHSASREIGRKRRRKYGRLLRQVESYRKTGRFLDVGCGAGMLLRCATERGWEAWGSDPAMKNGAKLSGGRIVPETLKDCAFDPGSFDVVHANELLEHVEDPGTLMDEIARVLRPGGMAVFRTPYHESWTARLVGPRWRAYSVLSRGHVGFLTPETFRHLFGASGLKLVRVATRHFSLRDRFGPARGPLGPVLGRVYGCVDLLARLAGRGERLTVWGEKE
ncbi:MAG: class I SAM-dependent methyltransferase [Planctomycetota bacterium]